MTARSTEGHIAVIGMSFRFPGADSEETFWDLVKSGRTAVRGFTDEELDAAGIPQQERTAKEFVAAAGTLGDVSAFDAPFFGVNGREAASMDPQQRLFLECAYHALEDGGYAAAAPDLRVGVFASAGYQLHPLNTYLLNNLAEVGWDVRDWATAARPALGTSADFLATRVAYLLDLTGPAVSVQTACSSALVAVHQACQALRAGDADLALAGASAVHLPQVSGYRRINGSVLSASGRCRAFDADADGTVGGSGVAAVLLKPLDRALADGDTVHAVIRGIGITNDGAQKDSYLAPSAAGQRDAVLRALETAGVTADSIGYLEAHGTGTYKGDPIEFAGLSAAFRRSTDEVGFCALGAVKSSIGHLDVCAGLGGLVKAVLVLKHGEIPPLAGFTRPNPLLDIDGSPFHLPDSPRPWPRGPEPRRAGVHSLAVGGTNVHIVLEEAPDPRPRTSSVPPPGLLAVSARDGNALEEYARSWRDRLRGTPPAPVENVLTTALTGRRHLRHRLVALGNTPRELADSLDAFLTRTDTTAPPVPYATGEISRGTATLAMLFSGQGSPYPGMARHLYDRFRVVREVLDECEHLHKEAGGAGLLGPLLDPGPVAPGHLWETETAQPALFAFQLGLTRLWEHFGVVPAVTAGHSVGEYAALCAAGAFSLADGIRLTTLRGRMMRQRTSPGGMLAALADREQIDELLTKVPGLELAAVNGTGNHVLAGPTPAVEEGCRLLEANGVGVRRLPVDRAFHTTALDPVLDELRDALGTVTFTPLTTPFVSSVDGILRAEGWVPDADYLVRQAREPVRFDAVLERLAADAHTAVLEVGPGSGLTGMVRRSRPGIVAVAAHRRGTELPSLWAALADLYCHGLPVDWNHVLEGTGGRRIPLPRYPFQRARHWSGPALVVPLARDPAPRNPTDDIPSAHSSNTSGDSPPSKENDMTESVLARVTELAARHLGCAVPEVVGDRAFVDLGADSFQMVSLLRELEEGLGVRVSMRELFEEASTPESLAALVAERMGPASGATETPAAPTLAPTPLPEAPVDTPEPVDAEPGYASRETVALLARQVQVIAEGQLQILAQLTALAGRKGAEA
ncbi:acyltransferase domain-containing protein [Streptomyces sp. NBC_01288]|uniref:type I polyketide synthase n=1 Tax=Streptomyces sp. NBC_01288 TaxID=2903814 RepID=UPI002E0ED964|nr:acyltransferase domain-containing protein [Streptomyces sp. NBC_01288]